MTTVAEARAALAARLREGGVAEPAEDARRLVAHALGIEPQRLAVERDRHLTAAEADRLRDVERQRLAGRTVARIVGTRAFHDITLRVADDVLEPRDDTGVLVELTLPRLRAACERRGGARLLDVGVGTGAVALALLAAEPRARGEGTDINPSARRLAMANAEALGLDRRFAIADGALFGAGRLAPYDLIVSNPPYVPSGEIAALAPEARADPREALDGGADGLDAYRALAREGARYLRADGTLAVEIGAGQGADVRTIFVADGWRAIGAATDLAGRERALAFLPGDPARGHDPDTTGD